MKESKIISLLVLSLYSHFVEAMEFKLEEATIQSIHDALKAKEITCESLVQDYLMRIKKYNLNKTETLNAFTELNTQVIKEAHDLDIYYQTHQRFKGPLHCIPTVIKDNIDVAGMQTTSGSLALLGTKPKQDAVLTAKLRDAGAIIIGKTTMDEFAWGMMGVSSRSGRTGNAYQSSQNPGGSSSGSAVAVSANFAVIGIGTDNSGSVRIPAVFNNTIGLRPSAGVISQNGIFPMGNLDGTAGPITRTITDLAKVMHVLAQNEDYRAAFNVQGLKNKRIGIVTRVGDYNVNKDMDKKSSTVLNQAYQRLKDQGAILVDEIQLPKYINNRDANQSGEIEDINAYFQNTPGPLKQFSDICRSENTRNFGDKKHCFEFMKSIADKNRPPYQKVLNIFAKNKAYIENFMTEHKLDALLMPIAKTGVPSYNPEHINTWQAPLASNAGLPAIALVAGMHPSAHLPIGFELIGKQFSEPALIAMALAYEKASPKRMPPQMPEANEAFTNLSIEELNAIYMQVGNAAYLEVIKKGKPDDLTAGKFMNILKKLDLERFTKRNTNSSISD